MKTHARLIIQCKNEAITSSICQDMCVFVFVEKVIVSLTTPPNYSQQPLKYSSVEPEHLQDKQLQ